MCGGRDRWRWDNKNGEGTWLCSHCGAGSGLKLVMLWRGLSFADAKAEVAKHLGCAEQPQKRGANDDEKRALIKRVWEAGKPLQPDSAAWRYLRRRTGLTAYSTALRATDKALYKGPPDRFFPALLAKVTDASGKPINVHRTFLSPDGSKAPVTDAKRMMPGSLPPGAAVRLMPPENGRLGIAEGIETSLCAFAISGIPTWAALNAQRLMTWEPPPGVTDVTVWADNDASFTGQHAAFTLAKRLAPKYAVDVQIPDVVGWDWADVWAGIQGHAKAG
jgi:putative DNA primase/helicase